MNLLQVLGSKTFSRNLDQFIWITREIRYHISITELTTPNPKSLVAELAQRLRIMMEIFEFSGNQ